jgi:hypothetical protein
VIDTEAAKVLNVLEVLNDAGNEIDVLNIKLNLNNEFLVAYVLVELDKLGRENICYYFVWQRKDYIKPAFITRSLQFERYRNNPMVSNYLLDIPVISDDCNNLVIDEASGYTFKPKLDYKEVNLKTTVQTIKTVTVQNYTRRVINYHHKNTMISYQRHIPGSDPVTLTFHSNERLLWQSDFSMSQIIVGLSHHYVAIATPNPPDSKLITVHRLCDGHPIFKIIFGSTKFFWIGRTIFPFGHVLQRHREETEVQFSRSIIACKGLVRGESGEDHPPFDLYLLDFSTGKVILECGHDLGLPGVKRFLLLEDSLVLEHSNKILLAKFWI